MASMRSKKPLRTDAINSAPSLPTCASFSDIAVNPETSQNIKDPFSQTPHKGCCSGRSAHCSTSVAGRYARSSVSSPVRYDFCIEAPPRPQRIFPLPASRREAGKRLKLKHLSSLQGTTKVLNPLSGMRSGKPTLGFPGTPCCASAYHCSWPPLVRPTSARLNVKRSSLGPGRVTTRLLSGPVTFPLSYFSCAFFVAVTMLSRY